MVLLCWSSNEIGLELAKSQLLALAGKLVNLGVLQDALGKENFDGRKTAEEVRQQRNVLTPIMAASATSYNLARTAK
jgi:hypothetical protein